MALQSLSQIYKFLELSVICVVCSFVFQLALRTKILDLFFGSLRDCHTTCNTSSGL